jgi:hypothetical protein
MDEVVKQAPDGMNYEDIELIFNNNNKDVLKTLIELWKIQEKIIKNISESQCRWEGIRDICDSHDNEMQKKINECKKNLID